MIKEEKSKNPNFSFYDGKEPLNKGVRINTDLSARELSEDIPTATYNPGSIVPIFFSGYRQ
jgi:hypothetical protein